MENLHFAWATLANGLPKKYYHKSNNLSDIHEIPNGLTEEERKYMEKQSHRNCVMSGSEVDCVV
jgi:hypothetical protein